MSQQTNTPDRPEGANFTARKVEVLTWGAGALVRDTPDSLTAWMARYLTLAVAGVRSAGVAQKLALHLERFRGFFAEGYGHDRISTCLRRDVRAWQCALQEQGLAAATVNNHVASLSACTSWVHAQAPGLFPAGDAPTLRAYARLYQAVAYVTSMRVRSEQADEPIYFYRQMETFARALGDDGLLNVALTYQGDMYRRKNSLDQAMTSLEAARDTTPGADDAARGNALQLLGRTYVLAGKFREADTALKASEDLALKIGEQNTSTGKQFHLPHVYEEFAKTYDAMGQPQEALDYVDRAEKAQPLTTATGMLLKIARGEILVHSGDLRNGVPLVVEVALHSRTHGNQRRLERVYFLQRSLNRETRQRVRAESEISEALEGDLSER